MKTIIYLLLATVIFGIVSTAFLNKTNTPTKIILLRSSDRNVSIEALNQSVDIIKNRLNSFTSERFDVVSIAEKNQIIVSFTNDLDINAIYTLLVQKGELSFSPLYDSKSLAKLLNGDNQLFSYLNTDDANSMNTAIGCASISKAGEINDYVTRLGQSYNCKFVWGKAFGKSDICLYALNLNDVKDGVLSGADVESIKSTHDKTSTSSDVEITFKKSAIDKWANITRMNINKAIAIVLDNRVLYTPISKSEIKNGVCSITGNFSEVEANFIASIGSNGVLPIALEVVK